MSDWPLLAFDVAAITVLGFGIYFPRYRRQDLLLSYIVLNLGVLTVMVALSDTEVGLGVGFGLFGILSIIRLRSAELEQQEIAYYFAALVLGLVNGVGLDPAWMAPAASVALLAALYFVDHPRVHPRYRNQVMTLDRAFTDETALRHFLEDLLGAVDQPPGRQACRPGERHHRRRRPIPAPEAGRRAFHEADSRRPPRSGMPDDPSGRPDRDARPLRSESTSTNSNASLRSRPESTGSTCSRRTAAPSSCSALHRDVAVLRIDGACTLPLRHHLLRHAEPGLLPRHGPSAATPLQGPHPHLRRRRVRRARGQAQGPSR